MRILILFFLFLFSCYSIPQLDKTDYPISYSSTRIERIRGTERYEVVGLELGELGLGGEIEEIIYTSDSVLIVGTVVNEQHSPVHNVVLHPVQKRKNHLTGKVYYVVLWEYKSQTDLKGRYKLSVPRETEVHGVIRYIAHPFDNLSAWLFL
jgi:hypothetical protein